MNLSVFSGVSTTRPTVVLLGAGASRGSSFVTSQTVNLPPLDADFFSQLSRLTGSEAGRDLLQFVREEYGHEVGLSMEKFFSEADYTTRFHASLKVDRGPRIRKYENALKQFFAAVADLLVRTTTDDCAYHAQLATKLQVADAVISFNYDCIMDRALKANGGNRWNPNYGYGFPAAAGGGAWRTQTKGKPPKGTIELLKLHGSLNWKRRGNGAFALAQRMGTIKSLAGVIIPPTWFKDVNSFPFREIWKKARLRLRKARALVVVGYSAPPTDTFSQALLKVELGSSGPLDVLVIANPDRIARSKFVELAKHGINGKTHLIELASLQELHTYLGGGS